ncbi:MAG: glycosyltransferase family 4 protein [Proteobacteria bacterium]|nr:glycosyltransferase family 4 protein [Pseudomonadota bacterium]
MGMRFAVEAALRQSRTAVHIARVAPLFESVPSKPYGGTERAPAAAVALQLLTQAVLARADVFDVIHWHIDSVHLPLARPCPVPLITTLHGRLDVGGFGPLHREFAELRPVSICDVPAYASGMGELGGEPSIMACPSAAPSAL